MTPEQERWAEALAVLRMHGDGAVQFIQMRLDELHSDGDHEGVRRWQEIRRRTAEALEAAARRQ